ncbi:TauD/TfdA dioxygenase family protein [Nostoc sp.]|uniref:TauD/TfdA dioxygenase family protein n=1 Tax=Nostoc sp. TaxID=1180 RepID=UPI002FF9A0B1
MGSQHFDIKPVAGRIGAEIIGVNLSSNLSDDIISDIRKTLVKYKVIFFRGQQQLDADGQVAFARRFGEVTTAHPTVPALPENPEVLDLNYGRTTSRANSWHTDVTFVDRPPLGSILRALDIPPTGGDTIWANSVTAYQDLPTHLRNLADQLWAVHSNKYDYATGFDLPEDVKAYRAVFTSTVYETLHPVVRIHPESGEHGLFIGGFVRQFRGLSTTESDDILRLLQAYVTRPENTVRWRWQVGDVAFWDNRATQHYAIADYGDQPRHVQRVTIVGDLPVGIDGKQSEAIKGDASEYNRREAVTV